MRPGGRDGWPALDLEAGPRQWWERLAEPLPSSGSANGRDGADGRPPFLLVPTLQRRVFDHCVAAWQPSTPREVLDCYLTSYFNAWLDYQSLYGEDRRWVVGCAGATGIDAAEREAFFADYPDGRLVVVVGDPQGADWAQGAESVLEARARAVERVLAVSGRELAEDPAAAMRPVAAFLGLEWDPVLTTPTLNGMPAGPPPAAAAGRDERSADRGAEELYEQLVAAAR
jgi:hypothetical protein